MPRNNQGVYVLPNGNPVVSGTQIQSTWANTLASDLANEITNSLDRNGRGGMLGPFKFADGAKGTPSLTFNSEPTLGMYRPSAGKLVLSAGNVSLAEFNPDSTVFPGQVTTPNRFYTGEGVINTDPSSNNSTGVLSFRVANVEKANVNSSGVNSSFGVRAYGVMAQDIARSSIQSSVNANVPQIDFTSSIGGANSKVWNMYAAPDRFVIRLLNDALNAETNWCIVTRSGMTVPSVTFIAQSLQSTGQIVAPSYYGSGLGDFGDLNIRRDGTPRPVAPNELYTLSTSDLGGVINNNARGKQVFMNSNATVDPAAIGLGGQVVVVNFSGGPLTLAEAGGQVMYWGGTSAVRGNRVLATCGICTILGLGGSSCVISGAGLS